MNRTAHRLAQRLWTGRLGVPGVLLDAVLLPAEALYRAGVAARNAAYSRGALQVHGAPVPAISVGNVTVGGTGKTPFAHWLAVRLRERGRRPAVLHGGYAADEPELHRRWAPDIPVIARRDRVAAARQAVEGGADVLVLDDAFQHRRLRRDLDLVLLSAERWPGRVRLLPRGPWREPLSALRRADLLVVTRKTATVEDAARVAREAEAQSGRPALVAGIHASRWVAAGRTGATATSSTGTGYAPPARALLVAGIGEPELFAENARRAGATIAERLTFPDHYAYGESDAVRILEAAAGRPIVTTEKDWTKLEPWLGGAAVSLLVQQITIEHGAALLEERLDRVLA